MKLVTVAEMKLIEEEANSKGVSYGLMMERAGKGISRIIERYYAPLPGKCVTALIGSGNNGGDALIALQELIQSGCRGQAYVINERKADGLIEKIKESGGQIQYFSKDSSKIILHDWLKASDIVIDGILGTGFKLPLKPEFAEVMEAIKNFAGHYKMVSVDCPSGIDCDSGAITDECILADITVCLQAVKIGLLSFPAYQFVGILEVVDLELPDDLESEKRIQREVATAECVRKLLPKRPLQSHKGTFGTALIIAGSINYTGAAHLAGHAAYRIGTGLVKMAIPGPIYAALAGQFPEATWLLLPHEMGVIQADSAKIIQQNLEHVTAILMGPGWGVEDTTREFLEKIITGKMQSERKKAGIGFVMMDADAESATSSNLPPLVIDADGLKLLMKIKNWEQCLPKNSVLTPHPGEMSILTELSIAEIQLHRIETANKYAELWGQIVVLKGALTVVAAPDGRLTIIPVANPALARAGTGDVLAGIITGMIAQGIESFEAAVAGVWIHAQSGIEASEKVGHPAAVMASDVLNAIPNVLSRLG